MRLDSYQERALIEYLEVIAVLASIGGLIGAIQSPVRIILEYLSMIQFEAQIIKKLFYQYRTKEQFFETHLNQEDKTKARIK